MRKNQSNFRVRVVPLMEELSGCVTEWRDLLLDKGLEVNASKSIVMFGRKTVVRYSQHISVVSVGMECRLRYVYRM